MARQDDWPTPYRGPQQRPLHVPDEWFVPFVTAIMGGWRGYHALRPRRDQVGFVSRPLRRRRKADKAQTPPDTPPGADKPPTAFLFAPKGDA